ncbi:MAG: hypothetical protein ACRDRA_05895 [Pseudonocardiaceae bacterium]
MADTDSRRLRVAQARAVNLYFLLTRLDDARAVLDAADRCSGAEIELLGVRALFSAGVSQLEESALIRPNERSFN